jgi:hypothetical protein
MDASVGSFDGVDARPDTPVRREFRFALSTRRNCATEKTVIGWFRMSGAPLDIAQPMHIHRGTCANLDPKPWRPLTALLNGYSESRVRGVTLAELEKGDYAINVHKSGKEANIYVACGNLHR